MSSISVDTQCKTVTQTNWPILKPFLEERLTPTAARHFVKFGYYGSSLDQIAKQLNLTPKTLPCYHSKTDLFLAIIERTHGYLSELFDDAYAMKDIQTRISLFVGGFKKILTEKLNLILVSILGNLHNNESNLCEAVNDFCGHLKALITSLIQPAWGSERQVQQVVENSWIYLIGYLNQIYSSNQEERSVLIESLCKNLERYWQHQSIALLHTYHFVTPQWKESLR